MSAQRDGGRAVLMVVTAADYLLARDGARIPTGFWASEVIDAHEVLSDAGYDVVVATPGGQPPTPDERSLENDDVRACLADIPGLKAPEPLTDCEEVDAFAAVVLPGGHGPMADLYSEPDLGRLLRGATIRDLPVAAICHGPAGLLSAQQDPEVLWPFLGKAMTVFRDEEEQAVGLADRLAWSLERHLADAGARLVLGEPFKEHVVVDDGLVTGQNPASARAATQALVEVLDRSSRGLSGPTAQG